MPTYEYACVSCGTHVEVYQRFNEESLTVCGVCGGLLRKVFHPAGILFKGSGFYATDSRSARSGGSRDGHGDSGDKRAEKGEAAPKGEREGASKRERASKREGASRREGASASASKDGASASGTSNAESAVSGKGRKEKSA